MLEPRPPELCRAAEGRAGRAEVAAPELGDRETREHCPLSLSELLITADRREQPAFSSGVV
jgi:hypothetical protein